ncbi:MAG: ribonuclease E inhibitor RraB [Fimbriimonadaceae bacterium]|nr:ribonuclease E inhibitor RraB [Fimbriimonadaceae bacterium]
MIRGFLVFCLLIGGLGCSKIPRPVDDYKADRAAKEATRLPKDPGDAQVYQELRKAGHDFTKPTTVDFYLYFPEEGAARGTLQALSSDGYAGEIKMTNGQWECHLTKTMVISAEAIDMERLKMREMTVNSGGHYDGWGAPVVK